MNTQSLVQWTYSGTDQTGFLLERSVNAGATWPVNLVFLGTTFDYIDSDVALYGRYSYRVAAANPKGTGSFSPTATVTIIPDPPQTFAWQNGSGSSATAFWNYQGPASMSLSRSSNGGATWPLTAVITPTSGSTYYYIDPAVSVGQTYIYRLQDLGNTSLPYYDTTPVVINPPSPVTVMAFSSDGGFEAGGSIPWEQHTASRLDMNNQIRGRFSASRFLLGGDNACQGYSVHQGYQGQTFALSGPSESIWAILGNHELSDMGGNLAFRHYFGYQAAQYMWREGCIEGVNITTTSETDTTYTSGSTSWLFLSNSLSRSLNDPSVAWRIVMVHAPVLSSTFVHPGNPTLAAIPWRQWGVDAVFSGHNHSVERLESSSVAFITCGGLSNEKSPYGLQTISPYSQWINADTFNGTRYYNGGYVYNLIQATDTYMSLSFYSSSIKLPDTGSTAIFNATMSGNSLILRKLPPQAVPSLIASTSSI